jgi:tetratricopeptide (TPR) repeat protein
MGEYSKALQYYQNTLEIQQQSCSSKSPDLTVTYNKIGLLHDKLGEYSKALEFHQKTLEIQQKTLYPNHPDLTTTYNNIGVIYDIWESIRKQ